MKQLITNCVVILLCLFTTNSIARNDNETFKDGQVLGMVIDDALNVPLPYVNIVIRNKAGEIVTGGITDENGKFQIKKVPEGEYTVRIQFIGFKQIEKDIIISRRNSKIDLGELRLFEEAEGLDEVELVAEVSTIQQKIDRKVINVGKDLTTSGPTASDIMNNLPSVNVDQQTGALSMRGNQNVRVMVDGKLSNIPAAQLLRQIPSTSIKKIELITNPSAKYNPEGMSGIINIILHKNTTLGFNGNLNVGLAYEREPKFNSSLDLNYRTGKFNFFGNYSNNISKNVNFGFIDRVEQDITQTIDILDDRQSHLVKAGVDVYLNDKNTLSFFTNQNLFEGGTEGDTDILNPDPTVDQFQHIDNVNDNHSAQYNFNYKLDFDKEGHNIELEADHNAFEGDSRTDNTFTGFFIRPDFFEITDTERDRT
ncbi:MAG: TonB-dependent receptor, partial [Bacteroidia bacterium]|nr:TonB-dependent receptor [Bacteroidia bacterium]